MATEAPGTLVLTSVWVINVGLYSIGYLVTFIIIIPPIIFAASLKVRAAGGAVQYNDTFRAAIKSAAALV